MWGGMPGQHPGAPGGPMPGPPGKGGKGKHGGKDKSGSAPRGPTGGAHTGWKIESTLPPKVDIPIFLEPAVEELVPVPRPLLGKIIGKNAQGIVDIREKSGAFKIDPRDQTGDPVIVKVTGTAASVKKAREIIVAILDSVNIKHGGTEYIELPREKIGMVIGLKGAQVIEIQHQTGTRIDVDFDVDPCRVYIKGSDDAVARAKQVLLTIAMQVEDGQSEYLDLPKYTSGALIGAGGSCIREFQDATGARIDIDKTGDRCRVRLSGTASQVSNAKTLILYQVDHAEKQHITNTQNFRRANPHQEHQPTSFPVTVEESIARAKAAAESISSGMVTDAPALEGSVL